MRPTSTARWRRARGRVAALAAVAAMVCGCGGGGGGRSGPLPTPAAAITLRSNAFSPGGTIPRRFTCDGAGVSPPLSWTGVPRAARELALVVVDPDAGGFVHWTVLGMAPAEHSVAAGRTPAGAVETENGFGRRGWGGPCPPKGDGPHRYVFALYATRSRLRLGAGASAEDVRRALARAAIARGTLTGRYGRD